MNSSASDPGVLRDVILDITETLLQSQIAAIKALRRARTPTRPAGAGDPADAARKGRSSQINVAFDILTKAGTPLHINDIIAKAAPLGHRFDRESLVSALTKRVQRADRFTRSAPNTFALISQTQAQPSRP